MRALNQKDPADEETITISSEEYERLLTKAYETLREEKRRAEKNRLPPSGDETGADRCHGDRDIDLRQLAAQRAQEVKGHLLKKGK